MSTPQHEWQALLCIAAETDRAGRHCLHYMLQTRLATVLALPGLRHAFLLVLAPAALAVLTTLHSALEALAVLLETGGFLAIAPFIVLQQGL